jgi:hypothetical protein
MEDLGKDDIPKQLLDFHTKVVAFSEFLQEEGEKKFAGVQMRPISHGATFRIHTWAIVLHRAVRDNCLIGWAQVTGVLLRTLLDCVINIGLIGEKAHDLRAFYFFYHYQLSKLVDSSVPKKEKEILRKEIQAGLDLLNKEDQAKVEDHIATKKAGGPYWFSYEYRSPSEVIKAIMNPEIRKSYGFLSGAAHGGHVTSNLFLDEPDTAGIDPRKNPKSAALAIIYSCRFLLEICQVRVHHEQPEGQGAIDDLMQEFMSMESVLKARPA